MATTPLHDVSAEISRLSEFSFGLPAPDNRPVYEDSNEETFPSPQRKRPRRSSAGDVAIALVILGAAIVGCFGINRDMVIRYFPRVAAVLHLSSATQALVLPAGANAQIKVWADRSKGLYYCPGSPAYGRTRNGRYLSQADALLASFEPAERKECTVPPAASPTKGGPHR